MTLSEDEARGLVSIPAGESLSHVACANGRVPVATTLALVIAMPVVGAVLAALVLGRVARGSDGATPGWLIAVVVALALVLAIVGVIVARRLGRTFVLGLTAQRLLVVELRPGSPASVGRAWDYPLDKLAGVRIATREVNVAPASAKPVSWQRLELLDAARPLRVDFEPSLMPGNVAHGNAIIHALGAA